MTYIQWSQTADGVLAESESRDPMPLVVNTGRIFSSAGRMSPTPPSNSEMPMNRTKGSGKNGAQKKGAVKPRHSQFTR